MSILQGNQLAAGAQKGARLRDIAPGSIVVVSDTKRPGHPGDRGQVLEYRPHYGPSKIGALVVLFEGTEEPRVITDSGRYRTEVALDARTLASAEAPANALLVRKKPIDIVVAQFTGGSENAVELIRWMASSTIARWVPGIDGQGEQLVITTLEGKMAAQVGDYIARGVKGEHYPVNAEVFQSTYDVIGTPAG